MLRFSPALRRSLAPGVRHPLRFAFAAFLLFSAPGCDDPPKPSASLAKTQAGKASAAPAVTAPPTTKPTTMPDVIVDTNGPYIGGTRINLAEPTGQEKLVNLIKDLPINGQQVTLIADKKAKTPHVAAVVTSLGDAGAPTILIKTDGRDDLPKEITVTPEPRAPTPPSCAVAATVLKDLSTAVWPARGGGGKKQRKGLAGPDLSHTGETLTKELAACESTVAFFSSDDTVPWELAFNIAGTVLKSDEKKKITSLVLLHEAPVAGRPISISKH